MAGYPGEKGRNPTVKENSNATSRSAGENGSTYDDAILRQQRTQAPTYDTLKAKFEGAEDARLKAFYNGKNPNVLHQYNSFNYIFTLRALSNDDLKASNYHNKYFQNSETFSDYIILRSGGYKRTDVAGTRAEINASEFDMSYQAPQGYTQAELSGGNDFKTGSQKGKDLFIDNVQLECAMDLGIQGTSNLVTGKFVVTEPFSVGGFYEELFNGSRFSGHEHYMGAPFLLSLEFIGHRFKGEELKTETIKKATRHFPIKITNSRMSVTEAGSIYNVEFMAVNHETSKTFNATLPENIPGPNQSYPTVGSILTDLFIKINTNVEQAQKDLKEKNEDEVKENPVSKKQEQYVAEHGKKNVSPFQPHRYMLWFPESYDVSMDTNPQMLGTDTAVLKNVSKTSNPKVKMFDSLLNSVSSDQYEAWKSLALEYTEAERRGENDENLDPETNVKDYSSYKNTLINASDISNSKMQSTSNQTYTGFFHVPELQSKVDQKDEQIKKKKESIRTLKTNLRDAQKKATDERVKIEKELEKYFKIPEKELSKILNEKEVEASEGAVTSDSQARSSLTYENFQEVDTDGDDARKTIQSNSGQVAIEKSIKTVNDLRDEYMKKLNEIELAKNAVEKAEKELEELAEAKGKVYEEKYERYGESRTRSWQFKKGTSIDRNIDKIIFDSVYSTTLDDEASDEYNQTGYINWYRIEKLAFIRGFDTYTNSEVYDFHYIIQPFKVHYSSLPIPQDVYNYDTMREMAVREYNYIYTGKNLDVLEFNLDFNNAFAATAFYRKQQTAEGEQGTVSTEKSDVKPPPLSQILVDPATNRVGAQRTKAVPQSASSTQTSPTANNASDTAKFLHDALYNTPGEKALITSEIKIAGDPVYLLSSGVTSRAVLDATNIETKYGEVNTFSREGDIVFNFGTAEDTPTASELAGGQSTMLLDPSVYSGLYKLIRVTSNFNNGLFTQDLETFRRPNQKQDYTVRKEVIPVKNTKEIDQAKAPADEENINKMKKSPKRKLSKEDLDNLAYHGPGALGGISSQAVVEIPSSAIGLQPNALGGSVFTSVSQAQSVAQQIQSGTFDPSNFTPDVAQKAIETNKNLSTNINTGEQTFSSKGGTGLGRQDIGT